MERPVAGDLVVVPWPIFDLSSAKRRPALVVKTWQVVGTTDCLLCAVSTKGGRDAVSIAVADSDLDEGQLFEGSYVRVLYLGTIHAEQIVKRIGRVTEGYLGSIISKLKDEL